MTRRSLELCEAFRCHHLDLAKLPHVGGPTFRQAERACPVDLQQLDTEVIHRMVAQQCLFTQKYKGGHGWKSLRYRLVRALQGYSLRVFVDAEQAKPTKPRVLAPAYRSSRKYLFRSNGNRAHPPMFQLPKLCNSAQKDMCP